MATQQPLTQCAIFLHNLAMCYMKKVCIRGSYMPIIRLAIVNTYVIYQLILAYQLTDQFLQ